MVSARCSLEILEQCKAAFGLGRLLQFLVPADSVLAGLTRGRSSLSWVVSDSVRASALC